MDQLLSLSFIFAALLAGAVADRVGISPAPRLLERAVTAVLWLLLLVMGLKLGAMEGLAGSLPRIGLQGILFALCPLLGTMLFLAPGLSRLAAYRRSRSTPAPIVARAESPTEAPAAGRSADAPQGGGIRPLLARLRGPLILVGIVATGAALSACIVPLRALPLADISAWTLYALLFLIGMQMSASRVNPLRALAKAETALVPLLTALGSLAGALLPALLLGIPAGKALAVGAGFGWYSLSSAIIAGYGDQALAATALLGNILRESVALVAIPFLARSRFPDLAIGAGGATAMDVTLPLIEQYAGPSAVPRAIASGAALTFLVPFLVPLFYGL